MVKFLSGTAYDGSKVPVCAYWSETVRTDSDEDYAVLDNSPSSESSSNCIANHYFARNQISCFNDGRCNTEGKCLTCTKYRYGEGVRMGISHSPPKEFLRAFNKGISDPAILSPQGVSAVGVPIQTVYHTQMPFHILIRNIQAEVAKCCRWSQGNGQASQFVITSIIDGPDEIQITGANGGVQQLKGIRVKNDAFPQDTGDQDVNPEGGSFFPVGLIVVAGWADAPSFYLEPRTGLVKPGEGVVFKSPENNTTVNSQAKSIARQVPSATNNSLFSIENCRLQRGSLTNTALDQSRTLRASSAPQADKDAADAVYTASLDQYNLIVDAYAAAQPLAATANTQAQAVIDATDQDGIESSSEACAEAMDGLAEQVDIANVNCGGSPAGDTAGQSSRAVKVIGQALRFAGVGGSTKCELAFTSENSALQWNSPTDGSLPCNGMRSDCTFYTGPKWEHATTEKMEIGQKVTAQAIQEVRFYSDDWSRYEDPEAEFKNRYSVPFIWAYKDFIDAGGTPSVADMLLYRPKTLFAREKSNEDAPGGSTGTIPNSYETMRVEKVEITNFKDFEMTKTASRILPGSEDENDTSQTSTPYATTIREFNVPGATRLKITHPPESDDPFIYRSWTPEYTNRISLFGSASPGETVYIVNNTALKNRQKYHDFWGSKNMFNIPEQLPGASNNFNGVLVVQPDGNGLSQIFSRLAKEKVSNQSPAVLGYDSTTSTLNGFWDSRVEVDLVHNQINEIYVFIFQNALTFVHDKVEVDCRVLHAIPQQTTWTGQDFTIQDKGGKTTLGIASGDIKQEGKITGRHQKIMGSEDVQFDHGYYAWQFKDRGLRFSTLNAGSDLTSGDSVSGDDTSYVTESDASAFITNVGYRVVQYRKEVQIQGDDWWLLHDCGLIMARILDPTANRVLPLPDQRGDYKALSPVLVNNGATGSVVAQWAPEKVTLTIGGAAKNLILIYRNVDGLGLPANYAVYGPDTGAENLFGRPDPTKDTLSIQYTYLRAQTHKRVSADAKTSPEGTGTVLNENYYGDKTRDHNHRIGMSGEGFQFGGTRPDCIGFDQQDYVFVYRDSESRPIGKKHTRFMVAYTNLACVSVEIFYAWESACVTYGLFPDLFLATGGSNGQASVFPKATVVPGDLTLGHRVRSLLGTHTCSTIPNCGDHEILRLGPLRKEFEAVANVGEGQKAFYPSAGQPAPGPVAFVNAIGSQYQKKRGTLWYPYIVCEKPRYDTRMDGPGGNASTELINQTLAGAGVPSGSFGEGTFSPGPGVQGGLPPTYMETHHTYDEVQARILDIHATLKACLSSYTYGNVVTGAGTFSGYARKRGEIDQFWYESANWAPPPFGNFGRPVLMCEVSEKIADYQVKFQQIGFRWMPMFPERQDLRATSGPFSEDLEPIHVRLRGSSSPFGGVAETEPTVDSKRYTHKSLLTNRGGGGIEYPYAPYYPNFLPDSFLGTEPEDMGIAVGSPVPKGPIKTGWAWREGETPIKRAQLDSDAIIGMNFLLPEYFLDNRRMEVRLRPAEGNYQISYAAPEYDEEGELTKNAEVILGDGPPREIIIDFVNRKFGPAPTTDTIYDTAKILGESPLDCAIQASSNRQLANECGCTSNVEDLPEQQPSLLPAMFLHGDWLAPGDYVTLYNSESMEAAFPTDIPREAITDPCCMCNYFIEQIYFRLDSTTLPVDEGFDPAYSNSVATKYTWSRVPHGTYTRTGRDESWGGQENQAQGYKEKQGLLTARPFSGQVRMEKNLVTAYWPSALEAALAPIDVPGALDPTDPQDAQKLLGGRPVNQQGHSQGQDERITMDWTFDTYASVKNITINFLAGAGMQVPTVYLVGIPPAARQGDFVTERGGILLATSSSTALGEDVPNPESRFSAESIRLGEVLFPVVMAPGYGNSVFWDQYFQEFHLVFSQRNGNLSMGIHSIVMEVDTMSATLVETIHVPERRYYASTFTPAGKNPDENLVGMDSCSAYWRSTSGGASDGGGNRFRAYAWGPKVNQESGLGQGGGQPIIGGAIADLEQEQMKEYDKARQLMTSPYTYSYASFFPLDEQKWMNFLNESMPSWTTTLACTIGDIDKVSNDTENDEPQLLYGIVPERSTWQAPGHSWVHNFVEDYAACCDGCGHTQLISYNFLHLHDGLAEVETAGFWDDFSNGKSYAGLAAAAPSISNHPDVLHLEISDLLDSNGNPIPASILNDAGFRRHPDTDQLMLIEPVETPEG